jgi:pimeloyl-ACP methyl ester carboxylesterase
MKFTTAMSFLTATVATVTPSCMGFVPVSSFRGTKDTTAFVQRATSATMQSDLTFSPPDMDSIEEELCRQAADRMQRVVVPVSESVSPSQTAGISYIHWPAEQTSANSKKSLPLVMVHGFDSSCLEYRRLGPQLAAQGIDVYAVDILGWGFTQLDNISTFSAKAKVEALEGFVKTVLGEQASVCVGGASLGGAAAIELAAANPDICKGLVLLDAQGFVDGVGPMAALPKPLAQLGVQVLKSYPLRSSANQMSYFDTETFATEDAIKIGRLHCVREGWDDALVSFMLSGGFSPSSKVSTIDAPSLVMWGRQDGILDGTEFANKFVETLPNASLRWIEECGHVPHLEQPSETANVISEFLWGEELQAVTAAAQNTKGDDSSSFPVGYVAAGASATAALLGIAANLN